MSKEKKEKKGKKTKKSQKEQFLGKSYLAAKDIKQVSQTKFNNLRTNIDTIKRITKKKTDDIYNTYPYEHIHYSIIKLGLKISEKKFSSHSKICLKLLETIRDIILEIEEENGIKEEKKIFTRFVEKKLVILMKILGEFVRIDETFLTLFDHFYNLLKKIPLKAEFNKAKLWFIDKIDDYIERRILTAEKMLSEHGTKVIKQNDNILIISISDAITKTLLKAHLENKINFVIYLIIEKNDIKSKQIALILEKRGLKIICTDKNNLSYFMNKINKVFTSGICIYSNGSVTSKAGTAIAAIFAKKFRKPFYVFIMTFKFSSKTQIDSLMCNESYLSDGVFFLEKDLVPDRLVSLLVTEIGLMPPTTVPVILREFKLDFKKICF